MSIQTDIQATGIKWTRPGLGISWLYQLSSEHPFFPNAVYHDAMWDLDRSGHSPYPTTKEIDAEFTRRNLVVANCWREDVDYLKFKFDKKLFVIQVYNDWIFKNIIHDRGVRLSFPHTVRDWLILEAHAFHGLCHIWGKICWHGDVSNLDKLSIARIAEDQIERGSTFDEAMDYAKKMVEERRKEEGFDE